LVETHFRLALAEIARAVLVGGGSLVYGGHLDPRGYTSFLVEELHKYGRRDRPLTVCLAWQEHRRMPLSELRAAQKDLGLLGRIVCLDRDGNEIAAGESRGEDPVQSCDPQETRQALTSLRRHMNSRVDGRVLIGGKVAGFQGELPGLMEEAVLACEARVPLYLAGGFGGATLEVIRSLGIDDGAWLPRRSDAPAADLRVVEGQRRLAAIATEPCWLGPNNGLDPDENRRLAATHRPSDIAALVCIGLGRRGRGEATAVAEPGPGSTG
jgi:hypothetical protein